MSVYFDNDVIHKLAACDLLDAALKALGIEPAQAIVLGTAHFKFFLHKPEKGEQRFGAAVFNRIRDFVNAATKLQAAPDTSDVDSLKSVDKIDAGEQILFSAASRAGGTLLTTGDKRALEALAGATSCTDICSRLTGRVMCLEQLLREISSDAGFAHLLSRVVPAVACDTTLRIVFSQGQHAKEADVLAGLSSYIEDLRKKTGALLK